MKGKQKENRRTSTELQENLVKHKDFQRIYRKSKEMEGKQKENRRKRKELQENIVKHKEIFKKKIKKQKLMQIRENQFQQRL